MLNGIFESPSSISFIVLKAWRLVFLESKSLILNTPYLKLSQFMNGPENWMSIISVSGNKSLVKDVFPTPDRPMIQIHLDFIFLCWNSLKSWIFLSWIAWWFSYVISFIIWFFYDSLISFSFSLRVSESRISIETWINSLNFLFSKSISSLITFLMKSFFTIY